MGYERMVNPVEVFRHLDPEAFDLLPSGAEDLLPEVEMMAEEAIKQGRPAVSTEEPEKALLPEDIVFDVLERNNQVSSTLPSGAILKIMEKIIHH